MELLNRVGVVSPIRPNWRGPVKVDYSYQTGIRQSYNGMEERDALRETARIALQYESLIDGAIFRRHMGDLARAQAGVVVVPARWEYEVLASSASAGQAEVEVTSPPYWMVAGANVMISNGVTEEAAVVDTVVGSTVTMTANLSESFIAGNRICRAFQCRAPTQMEFRAGTSQGWTGAVRYDVVPGSAPKVHSTSKIATAYDRELWLERPNWATEPVFTFADSREPIDSGRGTVAYNVPHSDNMMIWKFGYSALTFDRARTLIDFFLRVKGRRTAFYMPSHVRDLPAVKSTAGSGTTGLEFDGPQFHTDFNGSTVYNTLIAIWPDGSYQVNKISSTELDGGLDSVLTMEDTWDYDVTAATTIRWCPLVRFASDTLSVQWVTSVVAEMEFAVQTVQN